MQEYTITQNNLSVNRWKKEGALIASIGLLLLVGVVLAGGGPLPIFLLGAVIVLGGYLYTNDKIVGNIRYGNSRYVQQDGMQFQPAWQLQQDEDSESQQQRISRRQQRQNRNIQQRQIETITR
ncbi:MAG TPA: hypothetical protein VJH23_06425 [archaeon]|nr:hypothetical protein [archaeon]